MRVVRPAGFQSWGSPRPPSYRPAQEHTLPDRGRLGVLTPLVAPVLAKDLQPHLRRPVGECQGPGERQEIFRVSRPPRRGVVFARVGQGRELCAASAGRGPRCRAHRYASGRCVLRRRGTMARSIRARADICFPPSVSGIQRAGTITTVRSVWRGDRHNAGDHDGSRDPVTVACHDRESLSGAGGGSADGRWGSSGGHGRRGQGRSHKPDTDGDRPCEPYRRVSAKPCARVRLSRYGGGSLQVAASVLFQDVLPGEPMGYCCGAWKQGGGVPRTFGAASEMACNGGVCGDRNSSGVGSDRRTGCGRVRPTSDRSGSAARGGGSCATVPGRTRQRMHHNVHRAVARPSAGAGSPRCRGSLAMESGRRSDCRGDRYRRRAPSAAASTDRWR